VSDWTRIADGLRCAEIRPPERRAAVDRAGSGTAYDVTRVCGEDRGVSRLVRTTVSLAAGLMVLAGCSGADADPTAADVPSSVDAFPDIPHVDGPLEVRLQPGLPLISTISKGECAADPDEVCIIDGTYRLLGKARPVTIAEVRTSPSQAHTDWDAVVRFDPRDRGAVRAVRKQAVGMGGMVVVLLGDRALRALKPTDLAAGKAQVLGLEKPEAWAFVAAFGHV
jgi:hypothetical protein